MEQKKGSKMEELVKFEHVSKCFPNGVRALKSIDLTITNGEFISVIGPSGAGKSTFLRSINCLNRISEGKIFLEGEEITRKKGKQLRLARRSIGMIFQNYNLVYRLSVLQNVLHGRLGYKQGFRGLFGNYTEDEKLEAINLIEELGLRDYVYARASELSGGQKQRVGIARAIMQNPKLLLCDEPIASLDPSSAKVTMELLREMTRKRNITCIANLHQVDIAKKYSTRIIGLRAGDIVFDGTPEELTAEQITHIYGSEVELDIPKGAKNHA